MEGGGRTGPDGRGQPARRTSGGNGDGGGLSGVADGGDVAGAWQTRGTTRSLDWCSREKDDIIYCTVPNKPPKNMTREWVSSLCLQPPCSTSGCVLYSNVDQRAWIH